MLCEVFCPEADTASQVEHRTGRIQSPNQLLRNPGFCVKTKTAGDGGESKAVHHVRPQDRWPGIVPVFVDRSVIQFRHVLLSVGPASRKEQLGLIQVLRRVDLVP